VRLLETEGIKEVLIAEEEHSAYVKIDSKFLSGFFRIATLDIDGDNLSGDWKCKARVLEVTG